MHFFDYRGRSFYAEGVPVEKIIKEVGTPVYIYSQKTLRRHYNVYDEAFAGVPHLICYSIKANSNISILKTFAEEGSGFDIVSGGELFRALKAGADPGKKVFSGVGKRDAEKEYAQKKVTELLKKLRSQGVDIKYLDMGGGLGITYDTEEPPHPSRYGQAIIKGTKGLGVTLIFEPGRSMVGNAGILATSVVYTKKGSKKNFVIVDAAMNDLARPSLYGSFHAIKAVKKNGKRGITADVVGPICESGDFLAKDRELPNVQPGDSLAVMSAGAYGFSMSSNYNTRPRAAEVMVAGRDFHVIRKRESLEDLIKGEKLVTGRGARKR